MGPAAPSAVAGPAPYPAATATGRIARVLVDSPVPALDRPFDYLVPPGLDADAVPGARVVVPLRTPGRTARGFLVERADESGHDGGLATLEAVVSPVPVLAPEIARLARLVADRGAGGASDALRLAVPPRSAAVERAWLAAREAGERSQRGARGTSEDTGEGSDPHPDDGVGDGTDDAGTDDAVDALPGLPAERPVRGWSPGRLAALVADAARVALRVPTGRSALASGGEAADWAATLAELARAALATGGSALVVVPDHRDQDQVTRALVDRVGEERVVRADARQSAPARYRGFLRCLGDEPVAVVGSRAAGWAPARRLAATIVWDDGDPLHDEPHAPYIGSRDVALLRHGEQGGALVLAGHSRSTAVQRLVELGWLTEVVPDALRPPRVVVSEAQPGEGHPARIPSAAYRDAQEALATGPVLVQVARPGYAPRLACATCGTTARCAVCDGPLRQGARGAAASCGWCGRIQTAWRCPVCEGARFRLVTAGSARTAEELGRAFPRVPVVVSDGDRSLTEVPDRPALVVATRGAEPVAPGGYRAVLLLDGERMLARESLTVAEDALRIWSDAAVLAADRAPVHLVGVAGPLARALATWRQPDFAAAELADRRALTLPPAVRVASVTGRPDAVARVLEAIDPDDLVDVLGPVATGDEDGDERAVLRFAYAHGARVAEAARAAIVRGAAGRRPPATRGRPRPAPTLKVRFDDPDVL